MSFIVSWPFGFYLNRSDTTVSRVCLSINSVIPDFVSWSINGFSCERHLGPVSSDVDVVVHKELFEKFIFAQLAKEFLAFRKSWSITVLTKAHHLPCPEPVLPSIHPHTVSLKIRFNIISIACLSLSVFRIKIVGLCVSHFFMQAACSAHHIGPIDIFKCYDTNKLGEEYEVWNSSVCNPWIWSHVWWRASHVLNRSRGESTRGGSCVLAVVGGFIVCVW